MNKERRLELTLKAYEIAKVIEAFTADYRETKFLIERIRGNFEWAERRTIRDLQVKLPDYAVDDWGCKCEIPGTKAPEISKE